MTTSDDPALTLLSALLRLGEDSAAGYAAAARDLAESKHTRLFDEFRHERLKLTHQLETRIRELRGQPHPRPTVAGAVHRVWMDLHAAAGANPEAAVLTEIERGERLAVDAYRTALQERELDDATRRLFERQYEIVQAAHDRIRQLRDRSQTGVADQ